jgi:hypothetical protein
MWPMMTLKKRWNALNKRCDVKWCDWERTGSVPVQHCYNAMKESFRLGEGVKWVN